MSDVGDANDFNAKVIAEFRANAGKVGGWFEGAPMLLLHHRGATSGKEYVTPLVYARDGARYVVFASMAGAPVDPQWYRNLLAHPDVDIEVGAEQLAVRAVEAVGEERDRLYAVQAAAMDNFREYEGKAAPRVIPVVLLEPR
jgi:deazaflavin-dependent oxidoreductase (nitroreductase family)